MRLAWVVYLASLAAVVVPGPPAAEEEQAIRSQIEGYLEAWNAHDADGMAAYFDKQGDRVNGLGMVLKGRKAIRDHYQKVFSTAPPSGVTRRLSYHDISVRLVSPDAAVVDVKYEVSGVGPDPSMTVRGMTAVFMVKQDGKWLRAAHRNAVPTTPECVRECAAQQ